MFLRVPVFPSLHTWDSGRELSSAADPKPAAVSLKGQFSSWPAVEEEHRPHSQRALDSNPDSTTYRMPTDLPRDLSL